jgi:hypothetical protein
MSWLRRSAVVTPTPRDLVEEISQVLFASDPIGLDFEDNTAEYEPEARAIAAGLRRCVNAADVEKLVHGTFVAYFDDRIAGPAERYVGPSEAIWQLWLARRAPSSHA